MNLAIFDIDGTLTRTAHIDGACFVQALADAHALTGISTDWAGYSHTTDSGITLDIFQERFKRPPVEAELSKFKNHFVRLLEDSRAKDSSLFAEIRGAALMLKCLNREPEWKIAIASGGWRDSAVLKLKAAGIESNDYPAAFADDGYSREEILRSAVSKAEKLYRQNRFARIVSVGDGVWDVRTARNLELPFLGVGIGETEIKLLRAGATHVIEDFADYEKLIRYLIEAEVPRAEILP